MANDVAFEQCQAVDEFLIKNHLRATSLSAVIKINDNSLSIWGGDVVVARERDCMISNCMTQLV